jgi:radical SAM protein with 4Fe4S-binding SPASM domain
MTLSPSDLAEDRLGFFRWGRVAGQVLVTTDGGDWAFLSEAEFDDLLAGRIARDHPRFAELQRGGFLRDGLDLDALAARVARRNRHVRRDSHLHVVTLTGGLDMTAGTAEKIVDFALQSTSSSIFFELQGHAGEPLRNFEVVRHFVRFASASNQRVAGKTLGFTLVSNLTGMSDEAAEWAIANSVALRTSLDGPADVHDWNRRWTGGSAHADVVHWLGYLTRRARELGLDPELCPVDVRLTVTRRTLGAWREVVDEYVLRGMRSIHVRPVSPLGLDAEAWREIGYTAQEYVDFYGRTLDYVLELNRRGIHLQERTASNFLNKILPSGDPAAADVQSPCTAGTGEIAYDVDGRVFPGETARLVDANGDSLFELGNVRDLTIPDVWRHPTVRAIAAASLLDAQPMCADCWNKPFCGIFPVHTFVAEGDLFGQRPRSFTCKEHMGVSRRLFERLADEADRQTRPVLEGWVAPRPSARAFPR